MAEKMTYLDRVLRIAQHFPIFPCLHVDQTVNGNARKKKSPYINKWPEAATKDRDQIISWWTSWPQALVATPTGSQSGIIAVDLDEHLGLKGAELLTSLPIQVKTLAQKTPRGIHLIFKHDDAKPITNTVSALAPGIDTRGPGGYIIICPSAGYAWHGKLADIAPFPDEYYALLNKPKQLDTRNDARIAEPYEVLDLLNRLDPEKYTDYGSWTRIMLMCYHASGGHVEVREAFKKWSAKDEISYQGSKTDQQIEYQWAHAEKSGNNILSIRSLEYEVQQEHGVCIPTPQVAAGMPVEGFEDIEVLPMQNGLLQRKKNREIKISYYNAIVILGSKHMNGRENNLADLFQYNELTLKTEFSRTPPWVQGDKDYKFTGMPINDENLTNMLAYISSEYKADFSVEIAMRAIDSIARKMKYHPVRDYLKRIKWDGVKRLDTWLPDYTGCVNNAYSRFVSRLFLLGAVARAIEPGCQMDYMLVLEGPQGIRKTTLVRVLAGDWYRSPTLKSLGDKEAILAGQGCWIMEVEEMAAIKSTNIDAIKKYVTGRSDTIRLIYEKYPVDIPRGHVLIGTMNPVGDNQYLNDSTGARRFWPITCRGMIDTIKLEAHRDLILAEAYYAYCIGERPNPTDEEKELASVEQRKRLHEHPWLEMILDWLYDGGGREYQGVTVMDIWCECLGRSATSITGQDQGAIGRMMKGMNWHKRKTRMGKLANEPSTNRQYYRYMRPGGAAAANNEEDLNELE